MDVLFQVLVYFYKWENYLAVSLVRPGFFVLAEQTFIIFHRSDNDGHLLPFSSKSRFSPCSRYALPVVDLK